MIKLCTMKRKLCFSFKTIISATGSEFEYYYFKLTYTYQNISSISISDKIEDTVNFYMARNTEGAWKIIPDDSLPTWLFTHENKFGYAIDESLGFKEILLGDRLPNRS